MSVTWRFVGALAVAAVVFYYGSTSEVAWLFLLAYWIAALIVAAYAYARWNWRGLTADFGLGGTRPAPDSPDRRASRAAAAKRSASSSSLRRRPGRHRAQAVHEGKRTRPSPPVGLHRRDRGSRGDGLGAASWLEGATHTGPARTRSDSGNQLGAGIERPAWLLPIPAQGCGWRDRPRPSTLHVVRVSAAGPGAGGQRVGTSRRFRHGIVRRS